MSGRGATVAERHRFRIDALCMSAGVDEFEAWLDRAKIGASFVYARGAVLDQKRDVVVRARTAVGEGEIRTHQRRGADGQIEYLAVRCEPPVDGRAPDRRRSAASAIDGESPQGRIMAIVRRCIKLRQPMRTNAEIARELSLPNAEAARYEFNKLVQAGHLATRNMGAHARRVVTIAATGASTVEGAL